MKVLLAHNFYLEAGGEDTVFRSEKALLETYGVDVVPFVRDNEALAACGASGKFKVARNVAWSRTAQSELAAVLEQSRPDVVHFHNTFPMMSPSVYAACAEHGVPVVQTLHNYRNICPSATLFRSGSPCEDCVGRTPWSALRHRCYRGSLAGTAAVTWMLVRNRRHGVYRTLVHRYIALTRFAAEILGRGGLPIDRIEVKPNFVADPGAVGTGDGGYALFVGRLSDEKGVRVLIDAWRHVADVPLQIAGDGPLRAELEQQVTQERLNVLFLGYQPSEVVGKLVGDATCLVVPSICYEGFPMVIAEAYARGTPVVASTVGSLDELIEEGETGRKFPHGDALALASTVLALVGDRDHLAKMRKSARARFEARYTAERNFELLMGIYHRAMGERIRSALR